MISRMTCAENGPQQIRRGGGEIQLHLRLTTRFGSQKIPFAESTIMDAFMTRQAIMAAYMQTALYANELAGTTLRPAKLDAGP
jgi:hypothetical protein